MKGQPGDSRPKSVESEIEENEDRPSYIDTPFEAMPWEKPFEFSLLHTKVAEELLPEGPVEEDMVYTIAKNMFLKQRNQKIRAAKNIIAQLNPYHPAFDHDLALVGFAVALMRERLTDEEIEINLRAIGKDLQQHFKEKCPKADFPSPKAWARALLREVKRFNCGRPQRPDELYMEQAAALMTHEEVLSELDLEERYNASIERLLERLLRLKNSKQRIAFADRQRFYNSHPTRLA